MFAMRLMSMHQSGTRLVYFLPVLFFIVVWNQSHHSCVIHKFDHCVCRMIQSNVHSEYSMGLRTQPCGAPLLKVTLGERCVPSLTVSWLLGEKSLINIPRVLLRPRRGIIVINDTPPSLGQFILSHCNFRATKCLMV